MSNPLFDNVTLKTKRLIVRPFRPADARQLHSVLSQPNVMKYLPEDVMSLEEVCELIDWLQTCYAENRCDNIQKWTLAIVWNKTSQVIGWCGLGKLDFNPRETELFYGLSEAYWGKGIAAEACRAVIEYAFSSLGLTRIVAVVDPDNRQSQRVIEKLGMRPEKRVSDLAEEFRHYEGFLCYSIAQEQGL